ncbi:MAG: DNA polymerase-3 subunit delta' [Candidatus Azotimanducaceae bacterium]
MTIDQDKEEYQDLDAKHHKFACLPWQIDEYDRIVRQQVAGKLSHSLLIVGQEFLGKQHFAFSIAAAMLCENRTSESGFSCCACTGCHLFSAGTHPDFKVLKPEDSKLIKIEQIRTVTGWVNQTTQRGGKKVVIVHPAEQMTHQSANALLKCLEEPAGDSLIMLVTNQPGRLLPTIRSRCQLVEFHIPERSKSLSWLLTQPGFNKRVSDAVSGGVVRDAEILLDISGGAPLAVIERFDEAFLERRNTIVNSFADLVTGRKTTQQASEIMSKTGAVDAISCMLDTVADCLKYSFCGDVKYVKNRDMFGKVEEISACFDIEKLFDVSETLRVTRQELMSTSNPDQILLVESVLISLKFLASSRP